MGDSLILIKCFIIEKNSIKLQKKIVKGLKKEKKEVWVTISHLAQVQKLQ
jgi:hypothetical protein